VTPNCCGSWYQGLEFCNNQGCLTPAGHPNSHPYLPQLKANEWVHIAMRFEGTSGKAYWFIDGEQAAEFSGVSFPAFTGKDLYNGGDQDNGDSYNFTGRIDEAFWFARVLKPAEILGLYCHGARNLGQVPGKCSGVAEKGRYDHADIAVFSADGGSQLPTWVENDRRLWVRIPNQAAGKTVSYPVLFGSKDAYGGTDPNGVFLLYDGFSATDDAAPDAARWTANSGSGYAKTFERMICTRSNGGKSDDTTAAFLASKSTFAGGVAVEADLVTYSASINTFWSVLMEDAAQTSFYPTGKHVRTRDGTAPAEAGFRIVVDGQQAVSEAGIGVTRRLLTAWTGKDVTVRLDDVQKHLGPWSAAGPVRFVVGVRGGGTPGEYAEGCFDRLLARPYVSPEPTAVVVP